MITFHSIRGLLLLFHLLLTSILIWTRFPSIQIGMPPDYSAARFKKDEDAYLTLISFGIILNLLRIVMWISTIHQKRFRHLLSLVLDVVGSFFISWIIIDGLHWEIYQFIFITCVLFPAVWEVVAELHVVATFIAARVKFAARVLRRTATNIFRWLDSELNDFWPMGF